MTLIDQLDITITRWDCGLVRGVEINAGEPDQCGHRYTVSLSQHDYGRGYIIQTNFSDFYEQRLDLEIALGVALKLASSIDSDTPVPAIGEIA